MKIGIMQPYFFPYIGYFQLMQEVDLYVNLEHVSFMKRSYMTRNTIKNNTPINIPVSNGSQNKTCIEVKVLSVNTHRAPPKKRRIGQYQGFRPRYKRVIITLKPQDSISLFPEA